MKGYIQSPIDGVNISIDAIRTFAGTVAIESFGIVGMATVSVKDGLVKLLKREALQKGIEAEVVNRNIRLRMHIIVGYGISISAVCETLTNTLKYKVEEFTGMKVSSIEIFVEGVKPVD